jgi:hypothetical protein
VTTVSQIIKDQPDLAGKDLLKEVALRWRSVAAEEKRVYKERASSLSTLLRHKGDNSANDSDLRSVER